MERDQRLRHAELSESTFGGGKRAGRRFNWLKACECVVRAAVGRDTPRAHIGFFTISMWSRKPKLQRCFCHRVVFTDRQGLGGPWVQLSEL